MLAFRPNLRCGFGQALALLLACLVLRVPAPALADAPTTVVDPTTDTVEVEPPTDPSDSFGLDVAAKVVDVVFIRPFAFLATGVGALMLVPAAILSVADGNDSRQKALDVFVLQPWDDATKRELGR
jgi:hypothetical protein